MEKPSEAIRIAAIIFFTIAVLLVSLISQHPGSISVSCLSKDNFLCDIANLNLSPLGNKLNGFFYSENIETKFLRGKATDKIEVIQRDRKLHRRLEAVVDDDGDDYLDEENDVTEEAADDAIGDSHWYYFPGRYTQAQDTMWDMFQSAPRYWTALEWGFFSGGVTLLSVVFSCLFCRKPFAMICCDRYF